MAQLSHRISTINAGGSDGWDVFHRARHMIAQGIAVTELTIGEHDIRTDPTILSAMAASAKGGHTGYAMVPGIDPLRQAIADRVSHQSGVPTTAANVLITPGGQSALFSAHMATLSPGDAALYIDPFYATYPGTLRAASAQPVAIPTCPSNAFLPDSRDITQAAQDHSAKTLLINSPNNPTGTVYPRSTLQDIAQACIQNDLWLISDEVYETQIWEGSHLSPRALPNMAERTLVIGSMSKGHAMTGSRIGWIIGPETAISCLTDLATSTTYGVPGFIQDAALFALSQGPAFDAQIADPFRRRRTVALDIIAQQSTVRAIPSGGAMYLMLDIRATGLSGEDFALRLLEQHHIATMPGESFGTSAAGHLRIALTVPDNQLAQALTTLCDVAKELSHDH